MFKSIQDSIWIDFDYHPFYSSYYTICSHAELRSQCYSEKLCNIRPRHNSTLCECSKIFVRKSSTLEFQFGKFKPQVMRR